MRTLRKRATCHPEKPMRALGLCNSCYAKRFYKNRPEYAQKRRDAVNRWRAKNPEWAKRIEFEKHLRRKFGITPNAYLKMLEDQNGLCKICRKPESVRTGKIERRLAVDHCHVTGIIRGLLCFKCNTTLAHIESNPGVFRVIEDYLSS